MDEPQRLLMSDRHIITVLTSSRAAQNDLDIPLTGIHDLSHVIKRTRTNIRWPVPCCQADSNGSSMIWTILLEPGPLDPTGFENTTEPMYDGNQKEKYLLL